MGGRHGNVDVYAGGTDKVDCVVFGSKNYEPVLADLSKITSRFHTYFHDTIIAYGKDIEPSVLPIENLARGFG